ncbi:hypothetical protein FSARC_12893 [Fusarium sarcochroum]|uniref:Rhodopsin domain-containing protein n=1 Tax=Fusarium sarcochroum TaxID=1208366 RepID=A0A8H4WVL5_9HYPO|nr:hypothetical protein FSARC_12893 [Fusarium sarcochroum]
MFSKASSALVGEPPANLDDFHIIQGMLRQYGLNNVNASLGYQFSIKRPENPPDDTKVPEILAGMIIVILAIVVPTIARIFIRLKGTSQFGADDWAIIAAATGAGRHTYESTYEEYNLYMYYLSICRIIFYVAVGLIKISITIFVRRLADRASRKWKLFADIFLGFIFSCNPIQSAWDKKFAGSLDKPAVCVDAGLQNKFLSSMHVAQGIVLLLAPIIILFHVKINKGKKARLFFIWLVGGTTVIGGLLQQTVVTITNDSCWQYTSVLRWTVLDLTFGTLTASLPVLDAAIMGTWTTIKTKLGTSGSHSRSRTAGWTDLEGNTHNTHTTTARRAALANSESIENIIVKDKGGDVELNILRTDEVQLTYDKNTASRQDVNRISM